MLNQEYEQVTAQLDSAHGQRKEVVDRNRSLQDQLKSVKLENEELARRKVELTQELKRAKEDLSNLIEKGE
jgi:chromosome segregation ATPase